MLKKHLAAMLFASLLTASAPAFAAPFMFATFTEPSASQPVILTNDAGAGATITASTSILFEFTTPTGLSTTPINATLTITNAPGFPTTFAPAVPIGAFLDEPITNITTLSIKENDNSANLLTMTFTGDIVGRNLSPNGDITGSDTTGQVVTFSSSFLTFTQPGNSYDIGLETISPALSIGAGGYLSSFVANLDGMFSANAAPTPEPASLALLGIGAAALMSRRSRK